MELVKGPSLEAERERFGDVGWARPLLASVAEGLAFLHEHGVVHRDLKPQNVLLASAEGAAPTPKIADFGISRLDDVSSGDEALADTLAPAASPNLTATGAFIGTPLYMPPEAAVGARRLRGPGDVFSFGVMAYELLTGHLPWSVPAIYQALTGETLLPVVPIAQACAQNGSSADALPSDLAALLDGALAADPGGRPTARELARALRAA
jgi:serine/threonine-protein kinase